MKKIVEFRGVHKSYEIGSQVIKANNDVNF